MQIYNSENKILYLLITSLILFGFYLCFIGGYGSDEDTLPMIYVFEARLRDGTFVSSRFTGYPIPEIGIGFLSYFFGSWAANFFTFLFHLIGLILIYFSFHNKKEINKLSYFLILCLSSQVLFFDNLEPIDYSWAFLFFSLGTFFYSKKIFELAILAFAFAIGSRLNFLLFCIPVIFLFNFSDTIKFNKKLMMSLSVFIIGGLFYLPVWFDSGFGLDWLRAARPTEQGVFGLFARFTYKSWLAFGIIQSFIIIYFFVIKISQLKLKKNQLLIVLLVLNLLLFFYIPAELSYLQPALIFLYLILINEFSKKIILMLIFFNFFNWIINFQFLEIKHKDNSLCAGKQAVSASVIFKIAPGGIKNYFETRDMIKCWANPNTERGKRILMGKSTRVPN